jgi:hypothetical protein
MAQRSQNKASCLEYREWRGCATPFYGLLPPIPRRRLTTQADTVYTYARARQHRTTPERLHIYICKAEVELDIRRP